MTLTLDPDELIVVEAFAGPGGISEALRRVLPKVRVVGYEKDADACDTAEAAGHERIRADVSMVDLRPLVGHVLGFCAGPPCQSFSQAGRQLGRLDRPRIEAHIARIRRAGRWLHYSRERWHDPRSPLVLEVLRYVLTLRPEFVALEQVPQVLPLWELIAEVLRDHGWTVATGILKAEQYGVPQTRKRAILVASTRVIAELPSPTHRYYRKGIPREAGDSRLKPWVSFSDALGWGLPDRPAWSVTAGGTGSGGGVEVFPNREARARLAAVCAEWVLERPSPTVVTTRRSSEGVLVGRQLGGDPKDASQLPAVRVTVQEAAVLQSFRPDYPWRGSKSAQYRQVGDAAPPVLMAAVIREVTK